MFVRVRALLYSAVSQSASPRRVRGTARPQAPPAQRETRGGKKKRGRREGGVEDGGGGGALRPNQIAGERCCHHRRAVCCLIGSIFCLGCFHRRLLAPRSLSAPELRLDQLHQKEVETR